MFYRSSKSLGRIEMRLMGLYLGLMLVIFPVHAPSAPVLDEYKVKTALIYKLSKFVEWPYSSSRSASQVFNICLLGEDDFGKSLDALVGRKTGGGFVRITRYAQSESVSNSCQMLFISDSKRAFLQSILDSLEGLPTLTLSDMEDFAEQGGMIQFTRGERRIGFKINLDSVKQSELKISAPLLDLATIISSAGVNGAR